MPQATAAQVELIMFHSFLYQSSEKNHMVFPGVATAMSCNRNYFQVQVHVSTKEEVRSSNYICFSQDPLMDFLQGQLVIELERRALYQKRVGLD